MRPHVRRPSALDPRPVAARRGARWRALAPAVPWRAGKTAGDRTGTRSAPGKPPNRSWPAAAWGLDRLVAGEHPTRLGRQIAWGVDRLGAGQPPTGSPIWSAWGTSPAPRPSSGSTDHARPSSQADFPPGPPVASPASARDHSSRYQRTRDTASRSETATSTSSSRGPASSAASSTVRAPTRRPASTSLGESPIITLS